MELANLHLVDFIRREIEIQRSVLLRSQITILVFGGYDGGGYVVRFTRLEVIKFNERHVRLAGKIILGFLSKTIKNSISGTTFNLAGSGAVTGLNTHDVDEPVCERICRLLNRNQINEFFISNVTLDLN